MKIALHCVTSVNTALCTRSFQVENRCIVCIMQVPLIPPQSRYLWLHVLYPCTSLPLCLLLILSRSFYHFQDRVSIKFPFQCGKKYRNFFFFEFLQNFEFYIKIHFHLAKQILFVAFPCSIEKVGIFIMRDTFR